MGLDRTDDAIGVGDGRGDDLHLLPGGVEALLDFGVRLLAAVGEDVAAGGDGLRPDGRGDDVEAGALGDDALLGLVLGGAGGGGGEDRALAVGVVDIREGRAEGGVLLGGVARLVHAEGAAGGELAAALRNGGGHRKGDAIRRERDGLWQALRSADGGLG